MEGILAFSKRIKHLSNEQEMENSKYSMRLTDEMVLEIYEGDRVWASVARSKTEGFEYDIYNGPIEPGVSPEINARSFDQVAAATQAFDVNTDDLETLIELL